MNYSGVQNYIYNKSLELFCHLVILITEKALKSKPYDLNCYVVKLKKFKETFYFTTLFLKLHIFMQFLPLTHREFCSLCAEAHHEVGWHATSNDGGTNLRRRIIP